MEQNGRMFSEYQKYGPASEALSAEILSMSMAGNDVGDQRQWNGQRSMEHGCIERTHYRFIVLWDERLREGCEKES